MLLKGIDRVGDWNPQLLRELKGRLKGRNVAIAVCISILGQLLLFFSWWSEAPGKDYSVFGQYCRLHSYEPYASFDYLKNQYHQLQSDYYRYTGYEYNPENIPHIKDKIEEIKERLPELWQRIPTQNCPPESIDMQLWLHDHAPYLFTWLSIIVIFTLLVLGTYLLINDLGGEERRGSLNFIKLSPQSTPSILIGKLVGVPILLYLAVFLTVPLNIWSGWSAQIPIIEIIDFWVILGASCAFFFSSALLFGLVCSWFSGFQAWLGSGIVLTTLWIANNHPVGYFSMDWLNLFSPSVVLPYLINRTGSGYTDFPFTHGGIQGLEWFYLPVGATGISITLFVLFNYSLWMYWIWQALNRRFRNPHATILSKRHSFTLTACFEGVVGGFALQEMPNFYSYHSKTILVLLLLFNAVFFFSLISILSPHRQRLQDWVRYRQEPIYTHKGFLIRALIRDLVWAEKSPAVVAIGINLAIAITLILPWIILYPITGSNKTAALFGIALFISITLICATLAQLMLMMKTSKRALWATGSIVAFLSLPPIMLKVLGIDPYYNPIPWIFSSFPWVGIEDAATSTMAWALLTECLLWGLLTFQLTRQLRKAGESVTKALLAGHPSNRRLDEN